MRHIKKCQTALSKSVGNSSVVRELQLTMDLMGLACK
jgi:hypothetical protein